MCGREAQQSVQVGVRGDAAAVMHGEGAEEVRGVPCQAEGFRGLADGEGVVDGEVGGEGL